MSAQTPDDLAFAPADTVAFGERLAGSGAFSALFREGMSLIEETASYLDGPGRAESRDLTRATQLAYATESMRLTTRLMQLASWLLLQRAVNEGELSREQAKTDKAKMKIGGLGAGDVTPAVEALPEALRALIERSLRLQERIVHLDKMITEADAPKAVAADETPVGRDLAKLQAAFGRSA
jgi:regulator of CtrA degradation